MIGMLMSVMMMSNLPPASLRRPSTPSSASVTFRFFTRESASTRSCRIIGESSTTRQVYEAVMAESPKSPCRQSRVVGSKFMTAGARKRFRRRQARVARRVQIGGDERAPAWARQELEELAVDRHEAPLLGEQV